MLPEVRNYLDDVRSHLHLDPVTERQVISEFCAYFQERIPELQGKGIPERDATREVIKSFGRARVVARLMYEAHSKGSWAEAAIASVPHLIVAGLFASHLWHHLLLVPIAFALIVGVTLFGWWHGKPCWLYPWIGYSLLPLLLGGFASRAALGQAASFLLWGHGSLPSIWILLLIATLIVFSVWVIVRTTVRVVKRDWILASLMLVSLPVVGSWLFNLEQVGGLFQGTGAALHQWDMPMALAVAMLGVTSATFVRLRQRVLKIGALTTVGTLALAIVGHNLWGDLGFFGLVGASLLSLLFLLSPALLEARIGHGEPKGDVWWSGGWVEHPSTTR